MAAGYSDGSESYLPSPFGGSSFNLSNRFSGDAEEDEDRRYELVGAALENRARVEGSKAAYARAQQAAKAGQPSGLSSAIGTVASAGSAVAGVAGAVAAI